MPYGTSYIPVFTVPVKNGNRCERNPRMQCSTTSSKVTTISPRDMIFRFFWRLRYSTVISHIRNQQHLFFRFAHPVVKSFSTIIVIISIFLFLFRTLPWLSQSPPPCYLNLTLTIISQVWWCTVQMAEKTVWICDHRTWIVQFWLWKTTTRLLLKLLRWNMWLSPEMVKRTPWMGIIISSERRIHLKTQRRRLRVSSSSSLHEVRHSLQMTHCSVEFVCTVGRWILLNARWCNRRWWNRLLDWLPWPPKKALINPHDDFDGWFPRFSPRTLLAQRGERDRERANIGLPILCVNGEVNLCVKIVRWWTGFENDARLSRSKPFLRPCACKKVNVLSCC